MKAGEDIYVFKITDVRSKMDTHSLKALTNATMTLDFGDTCGEPVVIEWVRSLTNAEVTVCSVKQSQNIYIKVGLE